MRLYNYIGSANGYKVELALAQLGVEYQRVEIAIFQGEGQRPEFLRRNPVGRVPVLELDDGGCIAESNAILCHLASGTHLIPAAPRDYTRMLSWLFFEQSEIEPVLGSARFWILTGRSAERGAELDRRLAWARKSLAVLDQHLAKNAFLVENQYSIADIAMYAYGHLADDAGIPLAEYPAVHAWCRRVEAQPRYIAGPGAYTADALLTG
jgi:glutathione S-transferase